MSGEDKDSTISERLILRSLVRREDYFRRVSMHVLPEYFSVDSHRALAKVIFDHLSKYNHRPPIEALEIAAEKANVSAETHAEMVELLDEIRRPDEGEPPDVEWMTDMTESFCKHRSVYNAIIECIGIIDGDDKRKRGREEILEIVTKSTQVCFDTNVGHDWDLQAEAQYAFYTSEEERMPFDLDLFNRATKGGPRRKTLNVFMSNKTGGFKTGTMCHLAARYWLAGKNVLYITMEMSENRIRERIDANVLDIPIDDLRTLSQEHYLSAVRGMTSRTAGKLKIKEYPTGGANVGHFRFLLKELKRKQNFVPDVIFVDYLNICDSQRYRGNAEANSYTRVKSVAEELRSLAVESNTVMFSATQSGRQGVSSGEDIDLDDVSESYGLPVTVDILWAIIDTDELAAKSLLMFKQLKNRYDDERRLKKFVIGVRKEKMLLFDVEQIVPAPTPQAAVPAKPGKDAQNNRADWQF